MKEKMEIFIGYEIGINDEGLKTLYFIYKDVETGIVTHKLDRTENDGVPKQKEVCS